MTSRGAMVAESGHLRRLQHRAGVREPDERASEGPEEHVPRADLGQTTFVLVFFIHPVHVFDLSPGGGGVFVLRFLLWRYGGLDSVNIANVVC